jgi:hypothetical protein
VGHDADIAIVLEFGNASHRLVLSRQYWSSFCSDIGTDWRLVRELLGAKTRLDQALRASH